MFLFRDHGAAFATNAVVGSMLGIFATIAWALSYSAVAQRGAGLALSVAAGLVSFAVLGTAMRELTAAPLVLYLALVIALIVGIRAIPASLTHDDVRLPSWDLPARMILATVLVLTITNAAVLLGPRLAGLLATVPLYASILAGFGHTLAGPRAAIDVWRGLLFGLFGFGAFYLMLALFLEPIGLAAFALAVAAALITQLVTLRVLRS